MHEVCCEFRTVPCPRTNCQENVLFKDLDLHIQQNHKIKEKKSSIISPYLKKKSLCAWNGDWTLYYHQRIGLQFYPQFVKRNGVWYFWLKIKESPIEAAKWKFQVKLKSVKNQMSVEFSGLVHPVDKTVEEILKTGQYLLLDRQLVKKMKEKLQTEVKGCSSFIFIPFELSRI